MEPFDELEEVMFTVTDVVESSEVVACVTDVEVPPVVLCRCF